VGQISFGGNAKVNKLTFLVCENYLPEFRHVLHEEKIEDIELISFPAFCDGGFSRRNIRDEQAFHVDSDTVLICSQACMAPRESAAGDTWSDCIESPYCYSHLLGDQFARFFLEEGYYTVTFGWLSDWNTHLKRQGFTRETAREFYRGWCRKLVYLDSGVDERAVQYLEALSDYLEIPAKRITVSLDPVRDLIRNKLYEWRLKHAFPGTDSDSQIREIQEQNAKNAAVLNIMTRIAAMKYKREVIGMLQEVWLLIFGATRTVFHAHSEAEAEAPASVGKLDFPDDQSFLLDETTMTLYARIESGGAVFGVLEVGGFLFPENIGKYTELFDSIIKIASLAISNAQRYEDLTASRNRFEYSSYHDGLTGLYNRSYYKKLTAKLSPFHPGGVLAIDVDGLKSVNDTLGHSVGDILIQTAADVLRKTFRESDYVIRMGGDEFTVVIPDCDEKLARLLCDRLAQNVREADTGDSPALSMSFGHAVTADLSDDLEKMVHLSDFRMYRQKRGKKEPV
jgi:diguanylate cyclase (GGDEF)-like protein